jgi:hypothetical protein
MMGVPIKPEGMTSEKPFMLPEYCLYADNVKKTLTVPLPPFRMPHLGVSWCVM